MTNWNESDIVRLNGLTWSGRSVTSNLWYLFSSVSRMRYAPRSRHVLPNPRPREGFLTIRVKNREGSRAFNRARLPR